MKQKLFFGLQVFATLILFLTIFVSYLLSGTVQAETGKSETTNSKVQKVSNLGGLLNRSFTTSLTGIISCGK
jgi:hypothetical protein